MLTLEKITLKNFLSHADSVISFAEKQRMLIDGASGAGKSSIIDAVTFCLYGKGRVDNRSLIKKGSKAASVEITANDGEKSYKIIRSITDSGKHTITVEENGAPIKVAGLKNIQDYIERDILHASYLLFVNSAVSPQDSSENFIKQTAEKRKDLILEIINAASYDEYGAKARTLIQQKTASAEKSAESAAARQKSADSGAARVALLKQNGDIEALKNDEAIVLAQIEDAQKENAETEKIKHHLTQLRVLLAQQIAHREEAERNFARMAHELAKVDDSIKRKEAAEKDCLVLDEMLKEMENMDAAREAFSVWQTTKSELEAKLLMATSALEHEMKIKVAAENRLQSILSTEEKLCPMTSQPCLTLNEERAKNIEEVRVGLAKNSDDIAKAAICVRDAEKALREIGEKPIFSKEKYIELQNLATSLTPARAELRLAQEAVGTREKLITDMARVKTSMDLLADTIVGLEAEMTEYAQKITIDASLVITALEKKRSEISYALGIATKSKEESDSIKKMIEEEKANICEDKKIAATLESSAADLKLVKDAFSNNGIKSILVEYVLPRLEDKINEVLQKMSDFSLRIETQRDSIDGESLIEGLFLTVTNGQGESFELSGYSGGERMKISAAIVEGLASLQKIGFRILDESVTGLDNSTVESFLEVLQSVQGRFDQILCISHIQAIKDAFDEKITVTKINGDSFINESRHEQLRAIPEVKEKRSGAKNLRGSRRKR